MAGGIVEGIKMVVTGFFDSKKAKQTSYTEPQPILGEIQDDMYKEQIIAFVKDQFNKRQEDRKSYELRWRLTQNFVQGNQYCDINISANSIYQQEKAVWWQQREVYNHMAAILETRLAKLGRLRPSMTVRPATSENDDIASAKVCKSILDSTYQMQKMQKKINEANSWAEICGSVFYKNTWDSQAGELIGYIQDDGYKIPIYEGDLTTTIVPAYEIYPDSCLNADVEKCRSIIHARAYTVDEIFEIWNRKVAGKDVDVYSLGTTSIGVGGLGYTATVPVATQTTKKDSEIVIEYYELPTRMYPKGRLIIIAGDELLYYGTCPYKVNENNKIGLPFVRQECIKDAGSFFSTSVLERCIPIQRAYNAVKNRKHEYLNRCAIGVWTYEDNTLMTEEDVIESGLAPGTVLPRKPGSAPPSFLENGSIPPALLDEESKLIEEFNKVSGVSEMDSASQVPTGAGSGVSLEILKEQSDTRISLTADNIRQAIIDVSKHWLRLYKQFSTGPRMSRLVGPNNTVYVDYWTKDKLTSDDVVPLTDDDLAQTPAQKKNQAMEIFKAGLFNDPQTGQIDRSKRAKILEVFNYGNWEDGDDIDQLHINRAMRENLDVQQGYELRVRDFDDHMIHMEEHNKFRLSSEYDDLSRDRPDLAAYMDMHVSVHQKAIAMMQQNAMMQQAQAEQMQQPQQQNSSDSNGFTNNNIKGPRNPISKSRG